MAPLPNRQFRGETQAAVGEKSQRIGRMRVQTPAPIHAGRALVQNVLPIFGTARGFHPRDERQSFRPRKQRIIGDYKPALPVKKIGTEWKLGGGGRDLHVADNFRRKSRHDRVGNGVARLILGSNATTQPFAGGLAEGVASTAISSSLNVRLYTSGWAISPTNAALPLLAASRFAWESSSAKYPFPR